MAYYEKIKEQGHPVHLAAQMHAKLVNIHPFIDGNERTCRLVMNLILLQHGYPITSFSPEDNERDRYFAALNEARESENTSSFERFVTKNIKHWLCKYLEFLAPSLSEASQGKGYYFFKTIQPYLYP